jgi:hypothetical protein
VVRIAAGETVKLMGWLERIQKWKPIPTTQDGNANLKEIRYGLLQLDDFTILET